MKKQEEKFRLEDVYWACDQQGQQVIPYIFNTTNTRIKRLDNNEITNIIVPKYGSRCTVAGRKLLNLQSSPYNQYDDVLDTMRYRTDDVLRRCKMTNVEKSHNTILREYRKRLSSLPAHSQRALYHASIDFAKRHSFTAEEISELASELQMYFAQQYQEESNKPKTHPFTRTVEKRPVDAYEHQFEF